jgi:uncharacterized protein involved in outer membrane biogenesis
MSKSISIGFGIFALLLTALLVIPMFVDLNKWKADIESLASKAIGRSVHVDGDISLIILPYPGLTLNSVRISNEKWSQQPEMMTVEEITATVALLPLITKTLEFSQISLISPNIVFEVNKSQGNNWDSLVAIEQAAILADKGPMTKAILGGWTVDSTVPRINIQKGEVTYSNGAKFYKVTNFRTALKTNSVRGPYTLKGGMTLNGHDLEYKTDVGEIQKKSPIAIDINLMSSGQKLQIIGKYSQKKQEFIGQLASKVNPAVFLGDLSPVHGDTTVTADLTSSKNKYQFSKLAIHHKDVKIAGEASIDLGPSALFSLKLEGLPGQTTLSMGGPMTSFSQLQGKLELASENFQTFFSWLDPQEKAISPDLKLFKCTATYDLKEGKLKIAQIDLNLNDNKITGSLDISLPEINVQLSTPNLSSWLRLAQLENTNHHINQATLNGQIIWDQDVQIKTTLTLDKGLVGTIGKLSKDGKYALELAVSHPNLNELLNALGIEIGTLTLGKAEGKIQVSGDSKLLTFDKIEGSITPARTEVSIKGHGSLDFTGDKPNLIAQLEIGRLGLFELLAENKRVIKPQIILVSLNSPPSDSPIEWSKEDLNLNILNKFNADITLKTAKLILPYITIDKLSLPLKLNQGVLTAKSITGTIHGSALEGSASLSVLKKPQASLKLKVKGALLDKIKGVVDADIGLKSSGASIQELVSHLEGEVNLTALNITVLGFNAAQYEKSIQAQQYVDINKSISPKEPGGTNFNTLIMRTLLDKGVIAIDHLDFKGPNIEGQGLGTIDLNKQTIDLANVLSFPNLRGSPPFKVTFTGSLYEPQWVIDADSFSKYILSSMGKKVLESAGNKVKSYIKDAS